MNRSELLKLLSKFNDLSVAVVGDFFLDRYFIYDTALNEPSLETGLTAYQVVKTKQSPGACGTVVNNLNAIGTGTIYGVGFIGTQGAGYDLENELEKRHLKKDYLIKSDKMVTPQYIKTVKKCGENYTESNRFDVKNFKPTPLKLQKEIIGMLPEVFKKADAVIILDQMVENNCGVVTKKVREKLNELASKHRNKIIYADSRARIELFNNMIIKCNNFEACKAYYPNLKEEPDDKTVIECGVKLNKKNKRPVFITLGKEGVMVFDKGNYKKINTVDVPPPIDICGAGDSVTAAVVTSLAAGADVKDAGLLGNIAASITIRQVGTTGTASPEQILNAYEKFFTE